MFFRILLTAAVLIPLPPFASHCYAAAPPTDLQSKPVPNQLGLHLNEYSFSWDGTGQASYRILVAGDEKKLAADVGDLWDSGRRYGGPRFSNDRMEILLLNREESANDEWEVTCANVKPMEMCWQKHP